jgi:hypothetical protein
MEHFTDLLKHSKRYGSPHFRSIKAGNYRMSIQASSTHYCSPKEDLLDPKGYSSFEVAIYNQRGSRIYPHKSTVLKAFPKYDELATGDSVMGWVGVELLQSLYEYLKNY